MKYLHSMIRVTDLNKTLDFFCEKMGFVEIRRSESEAGRYTNVFLAARGDVSEAEEAFSPVLELTYNWPNENGEVEQLTAGRNFGHLAYRVSNIYQVCQKLVDQGVAINRPPRDGYMAFIKAPDGISIELLQEGEPLPAAEPWLSMQNTGSW